MDQVIAQVVQKTGISEDQARSAVQTVVDYLKSQLPAPIAGQIDSVLAGQGASGGTPNLGDMGKNLGGMFGGGGQ